MSDKSLVEKAGAESVVDTNTPKPQDIKESNETERIRAVFEALIREYKQTGRNATLDQGEIEGLKQKFFVVFSYDPSLPPATGGTITEADGSEIFYQLNFLYTQSFDRGRFILAENQMMINGKRKAVMGPEFLIGPFATQVADIYDDIIVQAASDVYKVPILHTRDVDILNRPRVSILEHKGYVRQEGSTTKMERLFEPRIGQS